MTLITLQLNDNEENLPLARTIVLCFTLSRYSWAKIQIHQHKPGDVIIHKIVDDVPDIYTVSTQFLLTQLVKHTLLHINLLTGSTLITFMHILSRESLLVMYTSLDQRKCNSYTLYQSFNPDIRIFYFIVLKYHVL